MCNSPFVGTKYLFNEMQTTINAIEDINSVEMNGIGSKRNVVMMKQARIIIIIIICYSRDISRQFNFIL